MIIFNSRYRPYTWQMNLIYNYIGKIIYSILDEVELPENHLTLNSSILLLIRGYKLPLGHKSIEEILKEQLKNSESENSD